MQLLVVLSKRKLEQAGQLEFIQEFPDELTIEQSIQVLEVESYLKFEQALNAELVHVVPVASEQFLQDAVDELYLQDFAQVGTVAELTQIPALAMEQSLQEKTPS